MLNRRLARDAEQSCAIGQIRRQEPALEPRHPGVGAIVGHPRHAKRRASCAQQGFELTLPGCYPTTIERDLVRDSALQIIQSAYLLQDHLMQAIGLEADGCDGVNLTRAWAAVAYKTRRHAQCPARAGGFQTSRGGTHRVQRTCKLVCSTAGLSTVGRIGRRTSSCQAGSDGGSCGCRRGGGFVSHFSVELFLQLLSHSGDFTCTHGESLEIWERRVHDAVRT